MKNVLEFLENSTAAFPEKTAVKDNRGAFSYSQLSEKAMQIGTALARLTASRKPIGVLMEKSCDCLAAFFGVCYTGCF